MGGGGGLVGEGGGERGAAKPPFVEALFGGAPGHVPSLPCPKSGPADYKIALRDDEPSRPSYCRN